VFAAIVIGASVEMGRIAELAERHSGLPPRYSVLAVVAAAAALSAPFWIGMIRVARVLGFELAGRAFPRTTEKEVDLAAAPRRLLVVTLQLAVVVLVGFLLVAVTQPFLPPLRGAVVLIALLVTLAFSFWRGAGNLQGHAKAAAQAIAEGLALQTREGRAVVESPGPLDEVNRMILGLGSPVSVRLESNSAAVGKTLAELNLRGLTGATVLAIRRGEEAVLVPSGHERLNVGDVLALAGTRDAVDAARALLETADSKRA
jgi:CPA2 family monovalent cation:H+ antiporter-2